MSKFDMLVNMVLRAVGISMTIAAVIYLFLS